MGLMTGSGPLGNSPAGVRSADGTLYLEPTAKRIRAVLGGETVLDTRRARLLHERGHQPVYYVPLDDLRSDLLLATDHRTHCPRKGDASYFSVGDVENVVWHYPEPLMGELLGLAALYWNRIDHWYEEDEEVFGHPRDPYHRVDVRPSSRSVRVSLNGTLLAESSRPVALFESNLPVRWYLPREDVRAALEPSETVTFCPVKGTAAYGSVRLDDGSVAADIVWTYAEPFAEASGVAGLYCFYDEHVDVELDGVANERPDSPWSGPRAVNRPPVQTRG